MNKDPARGDPASGDPAAVPLPWLASYPVEIDWHQHIEERSLVEMFESAVVRHYERPCIDFFGKRYTYREIGDLVDRAANGFRALGVRRGVNVALLLPNTPYYVVCFFAILSTGGTVVNLNPLYSETEIAHRLKDTATQMIVTLDVVELFEKASTARDSGGVERIVMCPMAEVLPFLKGLVFPLLHRSELVRGPVGDHVLRFDELTAMGKGSRAATEQVAIDPVRDVAVLQFTGGTSGTPKAAMLTHANLTANAQQVRAVAPGLRDGQERFLGVLPLCHAFGMTVIMNLAIEVGALMILVPRFDLKELLRTIEREKPSVFPGVPTIYAAINAAPRLASYDLSSIRFCSSGGAALPRDVQQQFETNTGCKLVEGYGLTESSPVATCNLFDGRHKDGSIGVPLPGTRIEIRSEDDPSVAVPLGERGEICVSGPQVMAGYFARSDSTARSMVGGWLRTGDIGYMDPDGYAYLVDRIKDVIIRDGYKVYPRIIEDAIREHPDIAEVVVIGVPDPRRGAYPKAFLRSVVAGVPSEEVLRAFLQTRLSPVEMPKAIEFRQRLPRTLIGKPDRRALEQEELGGESGGEAQG